MLLKLRIIAILLLVTAGLSAQGTSTLLEKRLSIFVENKPVGQVLKVLETAGDFTIAYSNGSFNAKRKVTVDVVDQSLKTILRQVFPENTIRFRELSGKLLIYKSGDTINVPGPALFQTVRGRVVDAVTHQPIPGVNVIILGSSPLIGASTDPEGRFRIERVPVGRHTFQVTFLGYLPKVLSGLSVDAGKEVVLNINMEESVTELASVVVTAELDKTSAINEMALVSAKSFSVEETSRYAGSFNDPARMATSYAGVVGSTDDTENSIIVRGNSPRGLLWRLEGMEIPNPNHFASDGSSNGAINMLNANMMTNSDFLTGAFPAEYGNAFSGVFDMKMRNGNNETREYALQVGLLGLEASLEGPFKRKEGNNLANASYLINYRYSTISMLEGLGLDIASEGQVPAFQDLSFKFNIPTAKAGTFSLYGLGGLSDSNDHYNLESNNRSFELDDRERYRMGLTGFNHIINTGESSFLETGLSYSRYDYDYLYENLLNGEAFVEDTENYINASVRASTTLNTKFSAKHSTKFGLIYTLNTYDLSSRGFFADGAASYVSDEEGSFSMYQAFVSHKYRLTNQLTLTGGLHYLRMDLAGQDSFEPRFGLRWQFQPDQALGFGFGMHSRKEETSLYFTDIIDVQLNPNGLSNRALDLSKARHFVLGYSRKLGNDLNLQIEAYYQDLYNIPISAVAGSDYSSLNEENAFQRQPLINEGSGENYGVEFTLEKFMSRGYFFLFTGTLYESTYETLTGIKYNTRYNGRYNLNAVGGREIQLGASSRNKTLNIGMEGVFGGGTRIRDIDLVSSIAEGRSIFSPNAPFASQLKDYLRIDFQVSLKTNKKNSTHELKLDVQNLTGRSNVIDQQFSVSTNTIINSAFTGEIIPVLSYKITF